MKIIFWKPALALRSKQTNRPSAGSDGWKLFSETEAGLNKRLVQFQLEDTALLYHNGRFCVMARSQVTHLRYGHHLGSATALVMCLARQAKASDMLSSSYEIDGRLIAQPKPA